MNKRLVNFLHVDAPKNTMFASLRKEIFLLPALLSAMVIGITSLIPEMKLPKEVHFDLSDKFIHFSAYFVLGVMFLWGVKKMDRPINSANIWLIILIVTSYGLLLEFLQHTISINRQFDWWDALANALGVVAGTYFIIWLYRFIEL